MRKPHGLHNPNSRVCGGCGREIIAVGLCYDCARPGQRTRVASTERFTHIIAHEWSPKL